MPRSDVFPILESADAQRIRQLNQGIDMRWLLFLLALLAGSVQAQIYRCETADGVEFSDEPCGKSAQVVQLEESTSGISGGPPDAVREELAEKKARRAEQREQRREAAARAPRPQPAPPAQVIVEQPAFYPGYWWRPNRPGRPPHHRPLPSPSPQPRPPANNGNSVLKPLP